MCPDKQPPVDKRLARLRDFHAWIDYFSRDYVSRGNDPLVWEEDAAEYLNDSYWQILEHEIRPIMARKQGVDDPVIDHHKIISVLEICIVHAEPVHHTDPRKRLFRNADFALFVARTFLYDWTPVLRRVPFPRDFEREHMTWLLNLGPEGYPCFSNAATWYCFELYCNEWITGHPA